MDKLLKHIDYAAALPLAAQTGYLPGQVVSKTLAQNDALSLTLFAFDAGEEISTHRSGGDAMLLALEGIGRVTVDGDAFSLKAGECIVMPAGHPHAVFAQERFKMFLVVVFPRDADKKD